MSKVEDDHFRRKKVKKDFVKKYANVWLTLSIVGVITASTFIGLFIWEDQVSYMTFQPSPKQWFQTCKESVTQPTPTVVTSTTTTASSGKPTSTPSARESKICREKHCYFELDLRYRYTMTCKRDGEWFPAEFDANGIKQGTNQYYYEETGNRFNESDCLLGNGEKHAVITINDQSPPPAIEVEHGAILHVTVRLFQEVQFLTTISGKKQFTWRSGGNHAFSWILVQRRFRLVRWRRRHNAVSDRI